MTMRFSYHVLALLALLAAGGAAAAPQQADEPQQQMTFAGTISMDQAVKIAVQRFQARASGALARLVMNSAPLCAARRVAMEAEVRKALIVIELATDAIENDPDEGDVAGR